MFRCSPLLEREGERNGVHRVYVVYFVMFENIAQNRVERCLERERLTPFKRQGGD
jgi:hypothetical protein